jgi:hypothetical protein
LVVQISERLWLVKRPFFYVATTSKGFKILSSRCEKFMDAYQNNYQPKAQSAHNMPGFV